MTDSHTAETSLADRLFFAQVAGCTCLTKTPETKYHKPLCHFRLFVESLKRIAELESRAEEIEKDE